MGKLILKGSGVVQRLHLFKYSMAVQYLNVLLGFVELFMFNWKWIFYFLLQLLQSAF